MSESGRDVVIVGGGVMGSACAWMLARAGARVVVLERSVPGAEASSAAAGIIGANAEAHEPGPMAHLMLASRERHGVWSRDLANATGIDVGFRQNGIVQVALNARDARRLVDATRWQVAAGVERLSAKQICAVEPQLTRVAGGVYYRHDGRIDPPLFFKAVHIAAQRAGAVFKTGAYVGRVIVTRGRVDGVLLEDGTKYPAGAVIVAAGSWSTLVEGVPLAARAVVPARGQIVELVTPAPLLERVVLGPRCYIVPRDDGRALVGSTLEFVGYRREVTARAVRDLLDAAIEIVPAFGDASVKSMWSNFRPYTPDELPILGESHVKALFLATGHYRTGILLAPITAECIGALVQNRRAPVSLAPFSPERSASEAENSADAGHSQRPKGRRGLKPL